MNTPQERLTPLDGLRGIITAGIAFFWHFQHFGLNGGRETQPLFWLFGYFYTSGWNLVDLFFVLSGFVMMRKYADTIQNNAVGLGKFTLNRLSRLYPLHIVTLLLVAGLQYWRVHTSLTPFQFTYIDPLHFILNLFMIQTGFIENSYTFNGPAWVLSVLFFTYIMFFLIIRYTKQYKIGVFLALIVFASVTLRAELNLPFLNSNLMRAVNGFFIGCLTYYLHTFIQSQNKKQRVPVLLAVLGTLMWIFLEDTRTGYLVYYIYGYKSLSVVLWPLLILVVMHIRPLSWLFSLAPLRYLGKISYSLYLIHFPVQIIIFTVITHFGITARDYNLLFIYIISALLAAQFTHVFLEVPAQRFIRTR